MALLEASGIGKNFGDTKVLKDISLTLEQGEALAIIGSSGSGKTTLLRCLNFLERPDTGVIKVNGETMWDAADPATQRESEVRKKRLHFGLVFQSFNLFPQYTALKNVTLARELLAQEQPDFKQNKKQILEEIQADGRELLAKMGLSERANHYPSQLSGGQQQRVALARILASQPKALLLDEPFSALDSYLKYQLELELAETLGGFPGTVLWVSHDRGEVFRNCRRVCVIDRGRSQPVTTLGELFRSPGTEAAARLSGCKNYADARPREDAVFLPDWGLTLSCGRPVPEGVCRIGIRAHHVQLAGPGAENAFSCTAVKVVEDVFSTIVLLRPEGAAPEAPLLRMELDKDNWQAVPDKDRLTVSVPPEAILLLES